MIENSYIIVGGYLQLIITVLFSFVLLAIAFNFIKKL